MPRFGDLHHVELQAVDVDRAVAEWGWLLTRLDHVEHQRWPGGASWIRGSTYVAVARAAQPRAHDRRGAGLNHLALHAGTRPQIDRLWHQSEAHGWRRLTGDGYDWRIDGDAESAFLESSERMKVELVVSGHAQESRHLSVVIRRDWREVAAFAGSDAHLPEWAAGLAEGTLRRVGDELIVDSPMGEVRVRFAPPNDLGVLDHEVTLPGGAVVHNPLRVHAHPLGAEVIFTLRRLEGATADAFEADAKAVAADLARLKSLVER